MMTNGPWCHSEGWQYLLAVAQPVFEFCHFMADVQLCSSISSECLHVREFRLQAFQFHGRAFTDSGLIHESPGQLFDLPANRLFFIRFQIAGADHVQRLQRHGRVVEFLCEVEHVLRFHMLESISDHSHARLEVISPLPRLPEQCGSRIGFFGPPSLEFSSALADVAKHRGEIFPMLGPDSALSLFSHFIP